MKTDIQIAQEAKMLPITDIATKLGIKDDELELYGKYKAKINDAFLRRTEKRKNGKLILVTAINPTPAGEGKTTTTVGLGMAMSKIGKNAIIALREPSLGPVFGIKGDTLRSFLWRTSIFTSQETSMLSPQLIISSRL